MSGSNESILPLRPRGGVPVRLARYVRRSVLPALRLSDRPFTLETPARAGTRSSLWLLKGTGIPPLLVRLFRNRRGAARNARALHHLEVLSLPAPRLAYHRAGLPLPLPAGCGAGGCITVETWIEGRPIESLRNTREWEPAVLEIARLLGRFRDIRRSRWGPPGSWQPFTYARTALWRMRRMVRTLAARGLLNAAEARQARRGFLRWRSVLSNLTSFSLSHRDAHPENFVLTASSQVVPVDLHRLCYAPFQEEIFNALHHVDPAVPGLGQRFLDCYFAGDGAQARRQFEATRGFFEPFYFLKRLHRWALLPQPPLHDPRLAPWRRAVAAVEPPGHGAGALHTDLS